MHRIDTSDNVASLPSPDPEGTPGFFTKGADGQNNSTAPGQDWFNMIQEELVNVVLQAGISLSAAKTNFTQLHQAIIALIDSKSASVTEANVGALTTKFISPLTLRSSSAGLLASNGYIRLPTWLFGLTIQWGLSVATTGGSSVSFPVAFPVSTLGVVLGQSGPLGVTYISGTPTLSSFTMHNTSTTGSHRWFAIGY